MWQSDGGNPTVLVDGRTHHHGVVQEGDTKDGLTGSMSMSASGPQRRMWQLDVDKSTTLVDGWTRNPVLGQGG